MRFAPIFILLLGMTPGCSSEDPPAAPAPGPAPVISSVSASVVQPGDVLTIAGANFDAVPERNRVVFNNELAKAIPDAVTQDTIVVTVPDYAVSGGMRVITSGQSSGSVTMEVQRTVGDVWVAGGSNIFSFKLPAPSGSEEYLMVPYSAAVGSPAEHPYTIAPDTTSVYPLRAAPARKRAPLPVRFDAMRRRAVERVSGEAGAGRDVRGLREGPMRDFLVLGCADEGCDFADPASYVTVTAELVATGTNVAVYADTSQPPGGFVQADYDAFAQLFDNQLFPADTMNFAGPTDIDGNGRIIVLFTPRVNELTPDGMADEEGVIAGFFHFNDLAIDLFPGTSNDGEILYMLVPDPTGVTGNVFEKSRVDSVVPPTAAHELEHCLSFGHRFITLGGGSDLGLLQDKWLEEGMAHVAEDLIDIDFGNVRRANRYMATPGSVSLKSDDTIEQRGAIFLFLRYIGDRFGEGVYRDIVQTRCRGELCVELATGVDFRQLVEEFFATLYLSQRGITSNPKFNFTSFDIQNDFAPLLITPRTIAEGSIDGLVQTMAANYYLLSGLDTPATAFRVTQSGDVRTIVVRTQ